MEIKEKIQQLIAMAIIPLVMIAVVNRKVSLPVIVNLLGYFVAYLVLEFS